MPPPTGRPTGAKLCNRAGAGKASLGKGRQDKADLAALAVDLAGSAGPAGDEVAMPAPRGPCRHLVARLAAAAAAAGSSRS